MTYISHTAALAAVTRFGARYDQAGLYNYRFEQERNGVSVRVYSATGTFLGYV